MGALCHIFIQYVSQTDDALKAGKELPEVMKGAYLLYLFFKYNNLVEIVQKGNC